MHCIGKVIQTNLAVTASNLRSISTATKSTRIGFVGCGNVGEFVLYFTVLKF